MNRHGFSAWVFAVLLPLSSGADPGRWNASGPDGGGTRYIIPTPVAGTFVVQTTGGLFRTTDHGQSWTSAGAGLGTSPGSPQRGTLVSAGGVLYTTGPDCSTLFR